MRYNLKKVGSGNVVYDQELDRDVTLEEAVMGLNELELLKSEEAIRAKKHANDIKNLEDEVGKQSRALLDQCRDLAMELLGTGEIDDVVLRTKLRQGHRSLAAEAGECREENERFRRQVDEFTGRLQNSDDELGQWRAVAQYILRCDGHGDSESIDGKIAGIEDRLRGAHDDAGRATSQVEELLRVNAGLLGEIDGLKYIVKKRFEDDATPCERFAQPLTRRVGKVEAMGQVLGDTNRQAIGDLLAVVHDDCGHHTEDVGIAQACTDAERVVNDLRKRLKDLVLDLGPVAQVMTGRSRARIEARRLFKNMEDAEHEKENRDERRADQCHGREVHRGHEKGNH